LETSLQQKYPTAHATDVVSSVAVNSQDHRRRFIVDNDFEVFILDNFIAFSGKENVIQWLDETEQKFDEQRIVRRLRFKAIPLLIEGAAKQKYLTHRSEIRSFDDFYIFLISNFDISNLDINQSDCNHHAANSQLSNLPTPFDSRSTDYSISTDIPASDITELTRQTPALYSTSIVNVRAANSLGEMHATTSVNSSTNVSVSDCDRTVNDLREESVSNSIGNPKTFKDGKVAMQKWIEEIQHFLEVANIPDSTRVDLISYSLRGDALERFNMIEQSCLSLPRDPARKMFSSISYNRYKHLGHAVSACSSL
jgi:hypothetical protein